MVCERQDLEDAECFCRLSLKSFSKLWCFCCSVQESFKLCFMSQLRLLQGCEWRGLFAGDRGGHGSILSLGTKMKNIRNEIVDIPVKTSLSQVFFCLMILIWWLCTWSFILRWMVRESIMAIGENTWWEVLRWKDALIKLVRASIQAVRRSFRWLKSPSIFLSRSVSIGVAQSWRGPQSPQTQ